MGKLAVKMAVQTVALATAIFLSISNNQVSAGLAPWEICRSKEPKNPTPECCPTGRLVQDFCGHWTTCAAGPGEDCSRLHQPCDSTYIGYTSHGLYRMVDRNQPKISDGNQHGICAEKPEMSMTCERKTEEGRDWIDCIPTYDTSILNWHEIEEKLKVDVNGTTFDYIPGDKGRSIKRCEKETKDKSTKEAE